MNELNIRYDELNFFCIVKSIVKNIWVILLICAGVLMSYTSFMKLTYKPRYTSSATFAISAKDSSSPYNSLTTAQSMASVFAEVFQSHVLADKIQERMGDEHFSGVVNTATVPETNLLIVSVTSPTPDMSFKGLTLVIENYRGISDYIFENARLEVIKDPIIPTSPSNPLIINENYPTLIIISALLSAGLIVVLNLLHDTVQTPKAAKRKIDARLLRTIHHEEQNKTLRSKLQRKNTAPLISNPLISKNFIEDNKSLCSALEFHLRKHGQKVIMITSTGENEGKSTVAVNLAIALAERNKKVLLLDCDFRKPALHKILENPVVKEELFSAYLMSPEEPVLKFLPFLKKYKIRTGFSAPNYKNVSSLINNGNLAKLIERMRKENDYIILDTPPILAAADAEALSRFADTSVMVVRNDFMNASAVNDALDKLRKNAKEVCGIVLNNYRDRLF